MLQQEFEQLTAEEFEKWNQMYMEGDTCKEWFCKQVKKFVREEPEQLPKMKIAKCTIWEQRCGVWLYLVEVFYVKDITANGRYKAFSLFDRRVMPMEQVYEAKGKEWDYYLFDDEFAKKCDIVKP